MTTMPERQFVSVGEAAKLTGIRRNLVWEAIQRGALPAEKMGASKTHSWLINRRDLDTWLALRARRTAITETLAGRRPLKGDTSMPSTLTVTQDPRSGIWTASSPDAPECERNGATELEALRNFSNALLRTLVA